MSTPNGLVRWEVTLRLNWIDTLTGKKCFQTYLNLVQSTKLFILNNIRTQILNFKMLITRFEIKIKELLDNRHTHL